MALKGYQSLFSRDRPAENPVAESEGGVVSGVGTILPNLDRLHELSSRLAFITSADAREPEALTWLLTMSRLWRDVAAMWHGPIATSPQILDALAALVKATEIADTVCRMGRLGVSSHAPEMEAARAVLAKARDALAESAQYR